MFTLYIKLPRHVETQPKCICISLYSYLFILRKFLSGGILYIGISRWVLLEAIYKGLGFLRTLSKFLVALATHLGPSQYFRML